MKDDTVETLLSETIGLDPESLGRKNVADATRGLMARAGIADARSYVSLLRKDAGELERLVESLVVPETWFFRDAEAFNYLRTHVREATRSSAGKPLRLLSVPCSTGEEPYSIAMTLVEMGLPRGAFRLDSAEISTGAIDTARRAVYGRASFREKSMPYRERYFTKAAEGLRLDPGVAGLVHFYKENFASPAALAGHEPYDIIFCKNLLIYLTEDARKRVIANIERLLVPGGTLFAGHSEMISFLQCGFSAVRHERSFACTRGGAQPAEAPPPVTKGKVAPAGAKVHAGRPLARATVKKTPNPSVCVERTDAGGPAKVAASVLAEIRCLADRGALDEALRACERFLEEEEPEREAFYLMGLIHLARNSFAEAETFFQKALYMDPQYYDALVHMELLYEQKGDRGQASLMKQRIERARNSAVERQEGP